MSLLSMLIGLAEADARFVVIGGYAAIAHGSPHVTDDLDICCDQAPDNFAILAPLLAAWEAYPRGVPPGLPFLMDARTLRCTPHLALRTREGEIDVFHRVAGVGGYERCVAASLVITLSPIQFRALDLDALIASKEVTGRRRDLEPTLMLRALRELKEQRERSLNRTT